jgi:hypothetical protein
MGDMTYALKCLDKLMTLRAPKQHNLWLDPKVYDKEQLRSLIFSIKEQMQRDMSSQLMTADPLQPDNIDAAYGYSGMDGMPANLNFGTTVTGFQEFI